MHAKTVISMLLAFSGLSFAGEPREIPLRTDLPAGEEWFDFGNAGRRLRKVTRPTITVFEAPKPNGAAIIVAPGGGFQHLAIDHEGYDVAKWLNQLGVTAMVLKYRVTMADREAGRKAAVEDGISALTMLRERAAEWKLDPRRIGIVGFSAGGYIAAAAAADDKAGVRPHFAGLIYAAVPRDMKAPAGAPPLFIACAHDDRLEIVENAARLLVEWKRANIPAELHVFHRGGHGFGMIKKNAPSDNWTDRFAAWLKQQGVIDTHPRPQHQ